MIINFTNELNKIYYEALRHYHNLSCVLCFGITIEKCFQKYTKYFNKDYAIYGIKNIIFENLNQKKIFFYQIDSDKIENNQDLEQYLDYYIKMDNVVVLILKSRKFENVDFKKFLKTKKSTYYADNLTKKMVITGIIFNNTSLNMMKIHNIEKLMNHGKSFNYLKNIENGCI